MHTQKKNNKIDKLKLISSSDKKDKKITNKKNEDFLLFNNLNDYEENELFNNDLFSYLERDEDLLRKNLFLGKKKYY